MKNDQSIPALINQEPSYFTATRNLFYVLPCVMVTPDPCPGGHHAGHAQLQSKSKVNDLRLKNVQQVKIRKLRLSTLFRNDSKEAC